MRGIASLIFGSVLLMMSFLVSEQLGLPPRLQPEILQNLRDFQFIFENLGYTFLASGIMNTHFLNELNFQRTISSNIFRAVFGFFLLKNSLQNFTTFNLSISLLQISIGFGLLFSAVRNLRRGWTELQEHIRRPHVLTPIDISALPLPALIPNTQQIVQLIQQAPHQTPLQIQRQLQQQRYTTNLLQHIHKQFKATCDDLLNGTIPVNQRREKLEKMSFEQLIELLRCIPNPKIQKTVNKIEESALVKNFICRLNNLFLKEPVSLPEKCNVEKDALMTYQFHPITGKKIPAEQMVVNEELKEKIQIFKNKLINYVEESINEHLNQSSENNNNNNFSTPITSISEGLMKRKNSSKRTNTTSNEKLEETKNSSTKNAEDFKK